MISPISITIDDIDSAANQFLNPTIFDINFGSIANNDNFVYVGTKSGDIKVIDLASKVQTSLEKTGSEHRRSTKSFTIKTVSELEVLLDKHNDEVNCLKATSDNNYLVSGSFDGTVKYWSLSNKTVISSQDLHSPINTIDISSNNEFIAAGTADGIVHLWVFEKNQAFQLTGHAGAVTKVAFTNNCKYIISVSEDTSCRIWNVQERAEFKTIVELGFVNFFQLTDDSKYIVAVTEYVIVTFYDIETGQTSQRSGNEAQITCMAVSKDCEWIVTGSNDNRILVFFVKDTEKRETYEGHNGEVLCVDITSDNKYIVSASYDCTVRVWDRSATKQVYLFDGNEAQNKYLRICCNNRFIICGSYDDKIRIWSTEELAKETVLNGHTGEVKNLIVTRDSKYLVSAGSTDNTIIVWNVLNNKREASLTSSEAEITALALSSDSSYLISASKDEKMQIYKFDDLKRGPEIKNIHAKISILQIALDNLTVVAASVEHKIHIWNLLDPEYEAVLTGHTDIINALLITTDSQKIVTASRDNTLRVWSLENSRDVFILKGHEDHVFCLQLTWNNEFAISGGDDSHIIIWSLITYEPIATLKGHKNEIKCLQLTRNQQFIVSGSNDKTIRIWNFYDRIQVCVLRGHERRVLSVEITNDDKYIVSSSDDGIVKIWNFEERLEERSLKAHQAVIHCLKVSNDDDFIVTSSKDQSIKIWRLDDIIVRPQFSMNGMQGIKIYGYDSGILNQIYIKKLASRQPPDDSMISAVIGPTKINLLHYYCYYDLVENVVKAQEMGALIFRDNLGRSPLYYAMSRKSRRCLDLLLNDIIFCKNYDKLEHSMHALRDDIIKVLDSHSTQIVPFLEAIFRKRDEEDYISFAAPKGELPITKFSYTILPRIEDFICGPDDIKNETQFLVQMWTSPLSWNFQNGSRESIKFLKAIIECPIIEIYETPFIKSIIRLKWDSFYYLNLFLTFIYAMNIVFLSWILSLNGTADIGLFIAYWIINVLLLAYEVFQMYSSGLGYFKSAINYHDVIRLALSFTWSIIGATGNFYDGLSFFTVIANFLRGLVYFRTFDKTRFYVRLIIRAAFDTVTFLMILLYSTFGFAVLYVSATNKFDIETAWKASFELDMGGFGNDGFDWAEYSTFTLASVLNVILMLNLLISILGKSFDDFQQSQVSMDTKEMLDVVIEFESLMFWARHRGSRTYLQKLDYFRQNKHDKQEGKAKILEDEFEKLKSFLKEIQSDRAEYIKNKVNETTNDRFAQFDKRLVALERQMQGQESRLNDKLQAILTSVQSVQAVYGQ